MKIATVTVILCLMFVMCTDKGQMKGARSFINNQTNHFIEILIYQNGKIVSTNLSVTIPANSNKEVENISEGTTSYAFNLISYDSLEVKFDNSSFLIHYLKTEGENPLAIKRLNPRNIYDGQGWERKITENTTRKMQVQYTYTLTEQDFINSKK